VTGKRQKHNKFLGNGFWGRKIFLCQPFFCHNNKYPVKGNLQKFWQFSSESWAAREKKKFKYWRCNLQEV